MRPDLHRTLTATLIMTAALTACDQPAPIPRSGPAFQGSAHWARDIAQPLIDGFAPDAGLYTVLGVRVGPDGRLPANTGTWSFVSWSPSRQEEYQVTVLHDGSTSTTTRAQASPQSAGGEPVPVGWVNSTVVFDATAYCRDPAVTLATMVVFNIATYNTPAVWGIHFDAGTQPNHYVSWHGIHLGTAPRPLEIEVCAGGAETVAVLVDPQLTCGIRTTLDRYENDLCSDGYTVVERLSGLASPADLRAYLADLYQQTGQCLDGAILIGDQPRAYQWVTMASTNPAHPPTSGETISYQHYADLDGSFAASTGYQSPGGREHSFDLHSGDVDWEIWIGVLPLYKGDRSTTVAALNHYFDTNHAYRTGGYTVPRSFLQISEHFHASTEQEHDQILAGMQSGSFAWTPFSAAADARLYFDSPPGGLSVAQGHADLSAGVADFTVLGAHGSAFASGGLTITWVESHPVRTAFFVDTACSAGDLDQTENVLTSLLYSPASQVVIAEGTTSDSGGMGTNQNGFFGHNIATALAAGDSFGQAMLGHVNVPLIHPWSESREAHFAKQVILGDPTLQRPGRQPPRQKARVATGASHSILA